MSRVKLICGDCIEQMAQLEESSIDAVVCDPPYGIGFMGHEWDQPGEFGATKANGRPGVHRRGPDGDLRKISKGSMEAGRYDLSLTANRRYQAWCEAWARECFRVLKPGGHLLAACGTRTVHRMTAGIEDAGFEIRDTIMWLYGSGFPKSLDVSKAIDKAAGAEREVIGQKDTGRAYTRGDRLNAGEGFEVGHVLKDVTAPATAEAVQWEGWGTALKPAHEPIVVARKPPVGTVAANVLEHGTGALNVNACRIGADTAKVRERPASTDLGIVNDDAWEPKPVEQRSYPDGATGRWPANVVLSHTPLCDLGGYADEDGTETVEAWDCAPGCPVAALDAQTGVLKSGFMAAPNNTPGDSGGASRFFYCVKTSTAEREAGLDGFATVIADPYGQYRGRRMEDKSRIDGKPAKVGRNHHPTVKPMNLMRWLVRLVTPPGGTCLDPFLGSGSTGCAAVLEGFDFVGIEREAEYLDIAKARITFWEKHAGKPTDNVLKLKAKSTTQRKKRAESGQMGLEIQTSLLDDL